MAVLPNAVAIDHHLNMGRVASELYLQALYNKGACTKRFLQGSHDTAKGVGSVYYYRQTGGHRWGGVCKALCIYWMSAHAADQDFWSWLFSNNGRMNAHNAGLVCDMQGAYLGDAGNAGTVLPMNRLVESKHHFMKRELDRAGLVERKTVFGNSRSITHQNFAGLTARARGRELAEILAPEYRMGEAMYKQLSFWGRGGAHATALWVAQDVMFFDPNFGEFYFEHARDFRDWFTIFWDKSGYAPMFQNNYTIHCFGKAIDTYAGP